MSRSLRAAVVVAAVLALGAPAQAASPAASVKPPPAGEITLAHLVFATKGASGTPKLAVSNRAKLSKHLTIAGGVKKLKKNSYLASIALVHRTGGGGTATPAFKLTLPKGMTFSKFTSQQIAKNLLSSTATPKFCGAVPADFAYIANKLLAGSLLPRFTVPYEYVNAGYQLRCPGGYEDRANLAAAIRGEPDPGGGGRAGDTGGDDCTFNCDGDGETSGEPPTSSTLTGQGTVASQGGNAYSYSMTFNEPITGYLVQAGGTSIACPNQYSQDACGPHNSTSAGGVTLSCKGGYFSFEFECLSPSGGSGRDRTPPPAVPANTAINGSFTIDAGSVQPGKTKVVAYGQSGKSQPITLSGP